MCGIVYAHGDPATVKTSVWEQYVKQKSRGTQGFGVFDGRYITRAATEKRIRRWFKKRQNQPEMLLFHHRYPTSTPNVKRAAHPFHTGDFFKGTRYVLVHNGVIRNDDELKKKHEDMGITYQSVLHDGSYNDSEALLWEVALTLEGQQDEVEATGDIAFICVKLEKGERKQLYLGRNYGRPLKMDRQGTSMTVASEGKGIMLDVNTLYTYNFAANRLDKKSFFLPAFSKYSNTCSTYQNTNRLGLQYSHNDYYEDNWKTDENGYAYYDDGDYDYIPPAKVVGQRYQVANETRSLGDILQNNPSEAEVNREFFRLLALCDGRFIDAIDLALAEIDYAETLGMDMTLKERRQLAAEKEAVKLMHQDPNYVSEWSVHDMWVNDTTQDFSRELTQVTSALLAAGKV